MSYQTAIGQVSPGQTLDITRTVILRDNQLPPPSGCISTISVVDPSGQLVTTIPALVTNIAVSNMPAYSGMSGYSISYNLTIPDNLLGTPEGLPYTALIEFTVSHSGGALVLPMVQEAFSVVSQTDVVRGPLAEILIEGDASAQVSYTFDQRPNTALINLSLYHGNQSKATYSDVLAGGSWAGPTFNYQVDATQLRASLMPHAALWSINGVKEISPLFVINPSIHLAMRELHDFVNKNCSDWATRELTFVPEQLIAALYNGACFFNTEIIVTNFTMLDARDIIRSFWIQCSAVWLLQSQVLNGIETDFQYTNASVTLDVDRASKYQSFASDLESSLRERLRPLKTAMARRGNVNGDGNTNPLAVAPGALGCVGLTLSPVSKVGTLWNPLSWRSMLLAPGNPSMNSSF